MPGCQFAMLNGVVASHLSVAGSSCLLCSAAVCVAKGPEAAFVAVSFKILSLWTLTAFRKQYLVEEA